MTKPQDGTAEAETVGSYAQDQDYLAPQEGNQPFTPEQLRAHCLALPGAFEDFPFGPETAVYKVQASTQSTAKVFALLWVDPTALRLNLKCEPALAEQLRETYPQVIPGYHMNKRHWNSVLLPVPWTPETPESPEIPGSPESPGKSGAARLRVQHVVDMIEDSYDLVVSALPAADRRLLSWTANEPSAP